MKKFALAALTSLIAISAAFAAPAKSLDSIWVDAGKAYPASGTFSKPAAWQPGQYVTLGSIVKGKKESVYTTLLVRQEEGGWVIENQTVDKKGKEQASQMLLKGFDEAMKTGDASNVELVWIKTLDKNGKVSVIEGAMIKMMKGVMKSSWERLVATSSSPTDGGAQAVPAGSFAGTSYVKSKVTVMGKTVESETWFHPAVPINGMVRSKATDGSNESVLIAFGSNGKPLIP